MSPIIPNPGLAELPDFMKGGLIVIPFTHSLISGNLGSQFHVVFRDVRTPFILGICGVSCFSRPQCLFRSYSRILLARQSFYRRCIPHGRCSNFPDFIQSLAGLLLANSLRLNSTLPGPFCSFQGLLLNSGDISSAIWSFVIALHTFLSLAGSHKLRHWVAEKSARGKLRWIICLSIWLSVLFIGVVGIVLIEKIQPERGPFCNLSSELYQLKIIKQELGTAGLTLTIIGNRYSFIIVKFVDIIADLSVYLLCHVCPCHRLLRAFLLYSRSVYQIWQHDLLK